MSLKLVYEPLRIGGIEIPNRIVRTAHDTGLGKPDITDAWIGYHAERARGGCGLTILEAASVHPSSALSLRLYGDALVPGYRRLMDAVRPHGMRVFQQLWHGGHLYYGPNGVPPAVSTAPSYMGIVGLPMTEGEIEELIDAFVQAALRCQEGGIDGVEIHAAHGYLFHQFLSPCYNNRTDRWGGDFEGRSRLLMETVRAVRKAVGPGFPVGVRLSASAAPGGVSEDDNKRLLTALQAESLIDFVDGSRGDYFNVDLMVGGMDRETGYELPSSSQILSVATVPRIVAGRFRTLEEAEQVLREGEADMVSMVRAQIADPFLVAKTKAGRPEDVRPCLGCNQGCGGGLWREGRLGCTVNPAVGYEESLSETLIAPAPQPRDVLVIGGGPAGMEAARLAALQGHRVTLAEASANLGGLVNVAKRAPKLQGLADIVVWQEEQLYTLGVDVRLNTYIEPDDARAMQADTIIVATGSYPRMDGFVFNNPGAPVRGVDRPHVLSSIDVLTDTRRDFGKSAVVMDTAGHYEALAACDHLVQQGLAVTLVCAHPNMTPMAQTYGRTNNVVERMTATGRFTLLLSHRIVEIHDGRCTVGMVRTAEQYSFDVPADTVVLVSPNEPLRDLYDALRDDGRTVHLVGDARSPRDMQAAIAEAHHCARALA
ncbi:MAG: FAD-dependent oxidoreductase [Novosphingobium sp.]|nr:FAD-dependent oxidoreductase [Novosphingobium sp.]